METWKDRIRALNEKREAEKQTERARKVEEARREQAERAREAEESQQVFPPKETVGYRQGQQAKASLMQFFSVQYPELRAAELLQTLNEELLFGRGSVVAVWGQWYRYDEKQVDESRVDREAYTHDIGYALHVTYPQRRLAGKGSERAKRGDGIAVMAHHAYIAGVPSRSSDYVTIYGGFGVRDLRFKHEDIALYSATHFGKELAGFDLKLVADATDRSARLTEGLTVAAEHILTTFDLDLLRTPEETAPNPETPPGRSVPRRRFWGPFG